MIQSASQATRWSSLAENIRQNHSTQYKTEEEFDHQALPPVSTARRLEISFFLLIEKKYKWTKKKTLFLPLKQYKSF
jgi:hypothetical protein